MERKTELAGSVRFTAKMDSRTGGGQIGLVFANLGHLILNSQLVYTLLGYVLRSLPGAERVRLTENSIRAGPS